MKIQDDWWQEGYQQGQDDKLSEILKMFSEHDGTCAAWAYEFLMSEGEE
jgi:hypothetical protein